MLARIPEDRRIAELYSRGQLIYPEIPEFEVEIKRLRDFVFENVLQR